MENKLNKKEKKSRALTIAENKRNLEIKHVLELRDEMIANNIDEKLIKKYVDEQYEKINKEFDDKIKKYQKNQTKKQQKNEEKDLKNKRQKAIDILLKNKASLEQKGYKLDYIKKYIDRQYKEINQIYSLVPKDKFYSPNERVHPEGDYKVDLEQVNFID